ncbi:response regulator [Desertivirga arenae]|uniref:response regulator n=1 Tax=Desertivirga arenae TaxID=2810309 RepID=UPI001A959CBB|nr:response regulator [Pedobacter sp. SYSU D00823]
MPKRILAVDDDQDILDCISFILKSEGYEVKGIPSRSKIIKYIVEFKPDLLILDINLGKDNGLEICKRLKNNIYTSHIPIIIISADPSINLAVNSYQADAIIEKPFEIENLFGIVNEFLLAKVVPLIRAS